MPLCLHCDCGQQVLRVPSKNAISPEKAPLAMDMDGDSLVPLSHFSRAGALCRELLHQCSTGRLIDLSPNGCDMSLAAIHNRVHAILVARSEDHAEAD